MRGQTHVTTAKNWEVELDRFEVLTKILEDGSHSEPFCGRTIPALENPIGRRDKSISRSRERFATSRSIVEAKLNFVDRRLNLNHVKYCLHKKISFDKLTRMNVTLGERIKKLRHEANLSLRQLAEKVGKTPPFISDVELGRRYPSEGVLEEIAKALKADIEDLKKLDTRDSVPLVKKMVENNPAWGTAFRSVAEAGRDGLTPEEFVRRLNRASITKKK
jgi:transcriptional regulator with XRE-family HTH domain